MLKFALYTDLWYNKALEYCFARAMLQTSSGMIERRSILPMENSVPQKQCTGPCQRMLPATAEFFYVSKSRKDGLVTHCKACKSAYNKSYRETHKEEVRAKKQEYQQTHKKEISIKNKAYRQAHKEELSTYQQVYRQAHHEKHIIYTREYFQTHQERFRNYRQVNRERFRIWAKEYRQMPHVKELERIRSHNRRALKHRNGGKYTSADMQKQYTVQKGKCYYCHKKLGKQYHIDHIVPLTRCGSNNPENLVLACPSCNLRKNNKMPHEWPEGGRLL